MHPLISVNLEATMEDQVVLLDLWASTYAMRVRIALAEKGVKFESKEENLFDKSKLLLEMNPVYKKVPVLIHNGRSICESLIILQYIDEVWNHQPALLPSDPHQRSQARFWADYIDKKVESVGRKIWLGKGEVQEEGKKELMEGLKTLEEELGEKPFFGGERLGFVDVILLPLTSWFYSYETCGNFSIEAECPNIIAWAKKCKQNDSVCQTLPDPQSINDYVLQIKKKFGVE